MTEQQHSQLPSWKEKSLEQKIETLTLLVHEIYQHLMRDKTSHILRVLEKHEAADDKEHKDIEQIVTLVQAYPNLFSPLCEIGHITGSAIVLDTATGRVLLHYHRSLNRWLQFGGHSLLETDPADIAMREAIEESGIDDLFFFPVANGRTPIDIDVHTIPASASKGTPEHLHLDFRYLIAAKDPEKIQFREGESNTRQWLPIDEAISSLEEQDIALARCLRKVKDIYQGSINTQ